MDTDVIYAERYCGTPCKKLNRQSVNYKSKLRIEGYDNESTMCTNVSLRVQLSGCLHNTWGGTCGCKRAEGVMV